MGRQTILHLVGIDVEARNHDHVLFAVDNGEIAVRVHDTDVAGQKPAVFHHQRGFFRLFPVARHDLRPLDGDLSGLPHRHFVAICIHTGKQGRRNGHADGALALLAQRFEGQQRRGFGQTVALQDGFAGQFFPAFGHRRLQGHAAAARELQMPGRAVVEPDFVVEPVEQRVHPAHPGDPVVLERAFEVRKRARAGDQDVARADRVETQHVQRKGDDVIEWQGCQHRFLALFDAGDQLHRLFHVHQQVRVCQHRAFCNARCAAGVLKKCGVIRRDRLGIDIDSDLFGGLMRGTCGQRIGQADVRYLDRFDALIPVFLYQPDDPARQDGQKLGHTGHDDIGDRVPAHGLRQLVGEHIDDDKGGGFGIRELFGHLLGGVKRVHVDQNAACFHYAKGHHRISEPVGHLQRHAVALFQPRHLAQVDSEVVRHPVHLFKAQRAVHAVGQAGGESRCAAIDLSHGADHVTQRAISRCVDLGTYASAIECRPRLVLCAHPALFANCSWNWM